jgi:hypothetical protein
MEYPDASGVPVNMLPRDDASAFGQLKALVDTEGSNLADPDWLGMLAALGIVKGQPFTPDAATRALLDRAAKTAYKTSRVIGFEEVSPAAASASIRTGAGSIRSPTAPHRIRGDRSICRGGEPRGTISISIRASGSSPITTRSVPA